MPSQKHIKHRITQTYKKCHINRYHIVCSQKDRQAVLSNVFVYTYFIHVLGSYCVNYIKLKKWQTTANVIQEMKNYTWSEYWHLYASNFCVSLFHPTTPDGFRPTRLPDEISPKMFLVRGFYHSLHPERHAPARIGFFPNYWMAGQHFSF